MPEDFPSLLLDNPPASVLTETFGWQPLNGGVLLVCLGLFGIACQPRHETGEWIMVAACLAAGTALLAWEQRRRARPLSLALKGRRAGLYRDGRLSSVIGAGELIVHLPDSMNTFKTLFGLGSLALGGVFAALVVPGALNKSMAAVAAACAMSAAVSSYRTRQRCWQYTLPGTGRLRERLLLRKQDGVRLFNETGSAAPADAERRVY